MLEQDREPQRFTEGSAKWWRVRESKPYHYAPNTDVNPHRDKAHANALGRRYASRVHAVCTGAQTVCTGGGSGNRTRTRIKRKVGGCGKLPATGKCRAAEVTANDLARVQGRAGGVS